MTNNEWIELTKYTKELCEKSSKDIRSIIYTSADDAKGFFFTLFKNDKPVYRVPTGFCKDAIAMNACIDSAFKTVDMFEDKPEKKRKTDRSPMLSFTTINIDGEYRGWQMTVNELREKYFSDDCDLPANDDTVVDFDVNYFEINGFSLYFKTFENILKTFGIVEL